MFKVVANSWALFFGLGLIMLGSGLQGSLLGLRASIEGFGLATTGLVTGAIFGMGAFYSANVGLSVRETSFFMSAVVLGGAVIQYPIGRLSDLLNRRQVIIASCACGAAAAFFAPNVMGLGFGRGWKLYLATALVGGFSMPLYALSVAHTNDYLTPGQMVAASSTLVLAVSIGSAVGTLLVPLQWMP